MKTHGTLVFTKYLNHVTKCMQYKNLALFFVNFFRMTDQDRYDRQLRLWGTHGQRKLSQASICCFGSSALACEILKNLVLPGIGSFLIIDNARVTNRDLGQNFFLPPNTVLGDLRAKPVSELLLRLNPTVSGSYEQDARNLETLAFDVCIVANYSDSEQVNRIACKYVIHANSVGFLGRLNVCYNFHHLILEAKSEEGRIDDYRLTNPWPELDQFADYSLADDMFHVPYFLILLRAVSGVKTVTRESVRDGIRRLDPEGVYCHSENFQQALSNTHRITALLADSIIVQELKTMDIVDDDLSRVIDSILGFFNNHGCLPLSGYSLPDMASTSSMYSKLCQIYKEKARRDLEEVASVAVGIDLDFVKTVVTNIRNLRVISPSTKGEGKEVEDPEQREIIDFLDTGSRGPLLANELDRYETGCELHCVSSVIGAVASQEIVKLITNQFTPLQGGFVFNGINGTAFTYG